MVALNLATKGRYRGMGFKGVALYVLHDKGTTETAERVGATRVENLPTDDPHLAWKLQIATAKNQNEIKRAAGVTTSGQKTKKPVFHFNLAWHEDDKPSPEHMMQSGRECLAFLGLEKHQALMVEHKDGKPHLHLVVNLISPEDGTVYRLGNIKRKLQAYGKQYELEQGIIRCKERFTEKELAELRKNPKIRIVEEEKEPPEPTPPAKQKAKPPAPEPSVSAVSKKDPTKLQTDDNQQLKALTLKQSAAMDTQRSAHQAELQDVKEAHRRLLVRLITAIDFTGRMKQKQEAELAQLQQKHTEERTTLQAQHEAERNKLNPTEALASEPYTKRAESLDNPTEKQQVFDKQRQRVANDRSVLQPVPQMRPTEQYKQAAEPEPSTLTDEASRSFEAKSQAALKRLRQQVKQRGKDKGREGPEPD